MSVGLKDEELGKAGMAQKKLGTSLVGQVNQKGQRQKSKSVCSGKVRVKKEGKIPLQRPGIIITAPQGPRTFKNLA